MTSNAGERLVVERAGNRCEYCRMHQSLQGATFHIEHIVPISRGGLSKLENLAWACPGCNLRKANRLEFADSQSGRSAPLFHPRSDSWEKHFRWEGTTLVGLTSVGRATISALDLNHSRRLAIRSAEAAFGLFPPDEP